MNKRFTIIGVFLVVVGFAFAAAGAVAYTKVQDGYDSLQAFSEAQNVTLTDWSDGDVAFGTTYRYVTRATDDGSGVEDAKTRSGRDRRLPNAAAAAA